MNKFAVAFAATSLMALAACGETPSEENNMASNEVMMNDMDAMNSANMMDNGASMMTNDMGNTMDNSMGNAAANEAGAM